MNPAAWIEAIVVSAIRCPNRTATIYLAGLHVAAITIWSAR